MEGEMTDTQDNRRGARRLWLWPVAVLVSLNRPGFGGGIDPTEGWSHVSTAEVSA
jgi:hypothetical protein